jgi:hypothetical protein
MQQQQQPVAAAAVPQHIPSSSTLLSPLLSPGPTLRSPLPRPSVLPRGSAGALPLPAGQGGCVVALAVALRRSPSCLQHGCVAARCAKLGNPPGIVYRGRPRPFSLGGDEVIVPDGPTAPGAPAPREAER